jgi:hypothetical protein
VWVATLWIYSSLSGDLANSMAVSGDVLRLKKLSKAILAKRSEAF